MKTSRKMLTAVLAVVTLTTQLPATADSLATVPVETPLVPIAERDLLANAFDGIGPPTTVLLDDQTMRDTRGELWPFVFGVVGLDLALAGYFWGVYVPAVGGSGNCTTCNTPALTAHH